jgi:hypothetical protein
MLYTNSCVASGSYDGIIIIYDVKSQIPDGSLARDDPNN